MDIVKPIKITFDPIKTQNSLQAAKVYISIVCLVKNIHLSNTEKEIVAYFMEGGINKATKDAILSAKLVKNDSNLKNALTRLRKLGLFQKDKWVETLCPELNLKLSNFNHINLSIDNR